MKFSKPDISYARLLKTIGWIGSVAVFMIILGASVAETRHRECASLSIKIDHDKGLFFLDEEDIARFIKSYCEAGVEGVPLKAIDFTQIERKLEMNPFIHKAEIFTGTKGAVHADIRQREPLVRVVNNTGVSYYLDVNGLKIPASSKFTARVVVATGNAEQLSDTIISERLMQLCRFITKNDFWKAQIEQINVTKNGEFEMAPKLANHIILLGTTDDLEEKFDKLMIFYKEVLKNFEAANYRIINLKYKDQIVCTKNTL